MTYPSIENMRCWFCIGNFQIRPKPKSFPRHISDKDEPKRVGLVLCKVKVWTRSASRSAWQLIQSSRSYHTSGKSRYKTFFFFLPLICLFTDDTWSSELRAFVLLSDNPPEAFDTCGSGSLACGLLTHSQKADANFVEFVLQVVTCRVRPLQKETENIARTFD